MDIHVTVLADRAAADISLDGPGSVAFLLNPATGTTCLRCCGTGLDPDPDAPTGIAVLR